MSGEGHPPGEWRVGLGLHTLQDATSPAHNGFQVWNGNETTSASVGVPVLSQVQTIHP